MPTYPYPLKIGWGPQLAHLQGHSAQQRHEGHPPKGVHIHNGVLVTGGQAAAAGAQGGVGSAGGCMAGAGHGACAGLPRNLHSSPTCHMQHARRERPRECMQPNSPAGTACNMLHSHQWNHAQGGKEGVPGTLKLQVPALLPASCLQVSTDARPLWIYHLLFLVQLNQCSAGTSANHAAMAAALYAMMRPALLPAHNTCSLSRSAAALTCSR